MHKSLTFDPIKFWIHLGNFPSHVARSFYVAVFSHDTQIALFQLFTFATPTDTDNLAFVVAIKVMNSLQELIQSVIRVANDENRCLANFNPSSNYCLFTMDPCFCVVEQELCNLYKKIVGLGFYSGISLMFPCTWRS